MRAFNNVRLAWKEVNSCRAGRKKHASRGEFTFSLSSVLDFKEPEIMLSVA